MPIMETITAQSASFWSLLPTVGPISVVESITNELSGIPVVNTSPMVWEMARRSPSDLLSFTRSLSGSANCWRLASLKPRSARRVLVLSISKGFWNLNCIAMPPSKSVLRFALPSGMAAAAIKPRIIRAMEMAKVIFLLPRKSIFVLRTKSIYPPENGPLYAYLFQPELLALDVEGHLRADEGGEEVYQYAEAKGDGKALYRAAAELEEDRGCYERSYVGVDYSPPGPVVARVYGRPRGASGMELLLYPLEYEDVGVDAHAYGKDYPGDAGKRQRGIQPRHGAEEHYYVEEYG